jgi:hypothetical protein
MLSFGTGVAAGVPVPCLICGHTFTSPAGSSGPPSQEPEPLPAPSNHRAVVLGGIAFAMLAVLMLGGMSMVLWTMFAREPAEQTGPAPAPSVAQAGQPSGVAAPKEGIPIPTEPVVDGDDVAERRKSGSQAATPPVVERGARNQTEPAAPTVTVTVPGGGGGGAAGVEQKRIDAAIAKGVAYLKQQQAKDGTWPANGPVIGYTALAGLTLLECDVPTTDPNVDRAAKFIRRSVGNLTATYELSLAILFLDRLGNPKDRPMIQALAVRLLAGQNEAGGWTYHQNVLGPLETEKLLIFLRSHRPAVPKAINPAHEPARDDPPRQVAEGMQTPRAVQEPVTTFQHVVLAPAGEALKRPSDLPAAPAPEVAKKKEPARGENVAKKVAPVNPKDLPRAVQRLPVVGLNWAKGKVQIQPGGISDNSNTQFALLGLWAARRHDVPVEHSLQLSKQRFTGSQNNDGGWGYLMGIPSTPPMTCVGLLGLAMGHGAFFDGNRAKLEDPAIRDGLRALGQAIGTPSADPNVKPPIENLYFLWSVERVAVLYDLKTIGGKDWYGWGAQTLLPNQHADGHWFSRRFHGSSEQVDTCFALLFLKRSNLTPDLTENLRMFMVIRDPEAK